jgi:hypothetical protein
MFQNKPNHFAPVDIRCADKTSDKVILHKMLSSWALDFTNSPWPCRVGNIDYDAAIKHAKEILIAEKTHAPGFQVNKASRLLGSADKQQATLAIAQSEGDTHD